MARSMALMLCKVLISRAVCVAAMSLWRSSVAWNECTVEEARITQIQIISRAIRIVMLVSTRAVPERLRRRAGTLGASSSCHPQHVTGDQAVQEGVHSW